MDSTGSKIVVGLVIWFLIIAVVGLASTGAILAPENYSGMEVSFEVNTGWIIDVEASSPVRLQVTNATYFGLAQGETNLYGIPRKRSLDDSESRYFFLEAEVEGKWEVMDGEEVTFVLTSKEDFAVRKYPSDIHAKETNDEAFSICGLLYFFTIFLVALLSLVTM